jgi:hypothetical protein
VDEAELYEVLLVDEHGERRAGDWVFAGDELPGVGDVITVTREDEAADPIVVTVTAVQPVSGYPITATDYLHRAGPA